jgi:hypothetical protein|tara:strand:- start:546 stop:845 length:300 start_codon:yes stop_codon:yes gene_type:complete
MNWIVDDSDGTELTEALNKLGTHKLVVQFNNAAGEFREMYCTTQFSFIPDVKRPKRILKGKSTQDVDSGEKIRLYKVFDLKKEEWRSFVRERIIKVRVE